MVYGTPIGASGFEHRPRRHVVLLGKTQVYKWGAGEFTAWGNLAMNSIQREVEILSVASCCGNRVKLWLDGPLGPSADSTYLPVWRV